MSDLNINNITDRTGGSGPVIAGVSTVTSTGAFTVPVGPTEMRGGRGRGVFGGGGTGSNPSTSTVNTIQYITIATTGNASDFGDLSEIKSDLTGCASAVRGFWYGGLGAAPGYAVKTAIETVVISSQGGASDWGSLLTPTWGAIAVSNSTRGIFAGGRQPAHSYQDVATMYVFDLASQGGQREFGELATKGNTVQNGLNVTKGGCASPTRGIFLGGGSPRTKKIDYVNISTLGEGKEFGEAITPVSRVSGLSNTTRGIFFGGYHDGSPASVDTNVMQYVTIASTGNAIDFGDMTEERHSVGAVASSTRGVSMGGLISTAPTYTRTNIIDYVTIASTGNAIDFGDLVAGQAVGAAFSDVHGGLG